MTRASRRGDTAHWMENRRRQYDFIEQAVKESSMTDYDILLALMNTLEHEPPEGWQFQVLWTDQQDTLVVQAQKGDIMRTVSVKLEVDE